MVMLAIAAAFAFAVAAALLSWRSETRRNRRFTEAVRHVDESLAGVGRSLRRALDSSIAVRRAPASDLGLVLDLDELLTRLAREAAVRAGTDAAAVRVQGAGDEPAVGAFGSRQAATLLESASRAAGDRPFRALTVSWTFPPVLEAGGDVFRSALIVPVLERGLETGAIAAFSREPMAFGPEHAQALEDLAAEAAGSIATARRFAAIGRRAADAHAGSPLIAPRRDDRRAKAPGDARS